ERVRLITRLVQVAIRKGVGVDNEDTARLEVLDVGFQGGRVHRDERIEVVAGCVDVLAAEMDLEAGDAGERAGRCTNLRREVGKRRDVIPEDGAGVGKLRSGEL